MEVVKERGLINYAQTVNGLHKSWAPHPGQIRVGRALFNDGLKGIFVQCGRKWGKTEFALYILWRWARLYPGSRCYYIAPFLKQAREIVWADPRITSFGPRAWLLPGSRGINNSDMRLNFTNGSFIKIDGSDNYDAHRGTRPSLIVYEEFKDHRPEFRVVMRPNLAVCNAPEVFIGTPPEIEGEFTETAKEHKSDPDKFFYESPTHENPHIAADWLTKEKKRLYDRGEGDVWEREYMARFVPGGVNKIFSMLSRARHMKTHAEVMREIERDMKKLEWFVIADPAASSVFGGMFCALNPYTKKLYLLDEIYETRQHEMSVSRIGHTIQVKRNGLWQRKNYEWRHVYDEAETWFMNEWLEQFPEEPCFEPTHKALNDKDVGVSLIKDMLLSDLIVMSDRCKMTFWEMDQYYRDKDGKIPKGRDHLIDCLRYALGASNYSMTGGVEYKEAHDENFRGARPSDDFPELNDDLSYREGDLMNVSDLWKGE